MSKSALKILNTAERLFNQNSFVGVGVDLIRDESGCSKTTMYTYFKNKSQLVVSVLQARDVRFRESLSGFVGDAVGLDGLKKLYDWHMQWFQTDTFKGCLFVRAVAESSQQDQEILAISQSHKVWVRDLIYQVTAGLNNREEITDMVFNVIEGMISRIMVEHYDQKVANQTWHNLEKIVQLIGT